MRPTEGVDHWPWRIRSSTELSSQTSFPVFLLTAMIDGARGEGTLTWLSSCPFDVVPQTRSPEPNRDQWPMFGAESPAPPLMAKDHTTSPAPWLGSGRLVTGPSFHLSRRSSLARHITTPRLVPE